MAELSKSGLTVTTPETSDSASTIDGDGLTVIKTIVDDTGGSTDVVVAEFTKHRAYTRDLVVATFATFGAHRAEAILGFEWDYDENATAEQNEGKITMGTGYAWVGAQTELVAASPIGSNPGGSGAGGNQPIGSNPGDTNPVVGGGES